MQIRDIMSKNVQKIHPVATLREAAHVMRQHDVGVLPVCDGERLVGVLTDRDIVSRSTAEGMDPEDQRVSDVMTRTVIHVYEDQEVQEAAWLMEIKRIRRLAVLNVQKRLVGIVSLTDLALHTHDRDLSGEVLEHVSEREDEPMPLHPQPGEEDPVAGWTFSRL